MTIIDWIWWSVGSVIGLGGIALTIWALFAGRSRGRRRCPKCWYEMTGVEGLRCPECGRTAKRERRLQRTRRRWRLAFLGMLVVFAGGGCFFGQQVHQKGWKRATPSIVYIAGLPWLDHDTSFRELRSRLRKGEMTSWECWCLVHRCIGCLENETDPKRLVELCRTLTHIEESWMRHSTPWAMYTRVSEIDAEGAAAAVIPLIEHEDHRVRGAAIRYLSAMEPTPIAMAAFMGGLASEEPVVRQLLRRALLRTERDHVVDFMHIHPIYPDAALGDRGLRAPLTNDDAADICRRIADCGYDHRRAADFFRAELNNPDARVRSFAIVGLAVVGDRSHPDLRRILELAEDEDESVRRAVVGATSLFPFDEDIRLVLERGLRDWGGRPTAIEVIGLHGTDARSFLSDLESIVCESIGTALENEIRSFVRIGGSREFAMHALIDGCDLGQPSDFLRGQLRLLADLGVESKAVGERLEPYLVHRDARVKAMAAYAYAVAGGDPERATRIAIEAYLPDPRDFPDLTRFAERGYLSAKVLEQYLQAHRQRETRPSAQLARPPRA